MNVTRTVAGLGAMAGLLLAFAGGAGVVAAQHPTPLAQAAPTATPPPACRCGAIQQVEPAQPAAGVSVGAPAATGSAAASGGGTAQPGIAYPDPIYPGAPGVAPDHTIVVVGFGQSQIRSDGSDRSTAERSAIATAMADARSQAEAVAAAGSLNLGGVVSVSVSVSPAWPLPIAYAEPGAGPATPPTVVQPAQPPVLPVETMLSVSATVAYQIR